VFAAASLVDSEYMRTSQLHGTVPHASKDQIIGKLECASCSVVDVVRFLLVFMFESVTVSPGVGAATARSSAILA
jgi:hypothetical protein